MEKVEIFKMWYCFTLNGQLEIINPLAKNVKKYGVEGSIWAIHSEATDIRIATDEEVKLVIERVRKEENLKRQINKSFSECACEV